MDSGADVLDYMPLLSSGSNLVDLVGSLHCDRQSRPTRDIHGVEASLDSSINCANVKHAFFPTSVPALSTRRVLMYDASTQKTGPQVLTLDL